MTTAPMYLLKTPGNHSIEISQDQLRSLLGEIEAELHRSTVYRRVLAALQNMLGSSAEQAKMLVKAVSREAIGLAFQQFAQQQQVADDGQKTEFTSASLNEEKDDTSELLNCLTTVKLHSRKTATNTENHVNAVSTLEKTPVEGIRIEGFNTSKNSVHIAAGEQSASIRQIGQKLRQARESQGMSLKQLQIYTHIPIHQMEAVENGHLKLLPEDAFVRGFIRIMGNALGLDGTALATSLSMPNNVVYSVLPSWYQPKNAATGSIMDVRPTKNFYLSYATLVAGAVGGLSLMTSQMVSCYQAHRPDTDTRSASSVTPSSQKAEKTVKPGIKSTHTGIVVGPDISPPEAL